MDLGDMGSIRAAAAELSLLHDFSEVDHLVCVAGVMVSPLRGLDRCAQLVLRQPAIGNILQHVQAAAKCAQNIQKDITFIKNSVRLSTTLINAANFSGGRAATVTWAQIAAQTKGAPAPPPPVSQGIPATKTHGHSIQGPSRYSQTQRLWHCPAIPNTASHLDPTKFRGLNTRQYG
ncbi:hypothetical protein BJY01DRAFT_247369 [Aspergillus pseudoustus]|uniref:Uncharacterized protein n=1 Tax=Aspergillus pseudoustus TaxID=1810923 RepID=A0ABR4K1J3_9EURO